MSIPKACIEAAHICQPTAEVRARGVIRALAENLPDDALVAACETFFGGEWSFVEAEAMRAALIAFLKDVVGETP